MKRRTFSIEFKCSAVALVLEQNYTLSPNQYSPPAVNQVYDAEKTVKVLRLWTHYE